MRRAFRRPIYGVAFALGLLGLLEGAMRLFPEPRAPELVVFQPHPTRIWALEEGEDMAAMVRVRIDADGLRLPARPGKEGAPVILTVGDSSIFGHGVPDGETLHDQLQQQLDDGGLPTRVLCGAVPGYSTLQSERLLEEVGWARNPKLLVVANLWSDNNIDGFTDAALMSALQSPAANLERLLSHSALFRQTRLQLNSLLGRPTRWKVSWPTASQQGVRRVPLPDYAQALGRIFAAARSRQVGVVVVALSNTWLFAHDRNAATSWKPYFEAQKRVADAWQVPYLDSLPALQATGQPAEALFVDALHPSGQGHAVIAKLIADLLLKKGWPELPVPPDTLPALPADPGGGQLEPDSLQGRMMMAQP
ncbi:MAG TPA: SGNH/GDSL hydrolase family protein [Myxococcota bacterium]|nr:SGNH/GDSL hydrolase family protein [Myxococcota bacterium]